MSSELAVAVWGLGRHATRRILPALAQSDVVDVAGICTRNKARGRAEAAKFGCKYFESPDQMLNDDRVHVVFVTTPTGLHFSHGLRVLEAGKHLWCEKPMTHSHATTCRLFEVAATKGVSAVSGLMYKYHPQFIALKRFIHGEKLGQLKSLSIRFGMPSLDVDTFRDDPELGGGALLDISCYPLSAAYQLLSKPPELQWATVGTQPPSKVDTDGWAILQRDGVVVDCGWGMGRAYQNRMDVWGSDGLLFCDRAFSKEEDFDANLVVFDRRGQESAVITTGRANSYLAMINSLAACVAGEAFFAEERAETEWCALLAEQIALA